MGQSNGHDVKRRAWIVDDESLATMKARAEAEGRLAARVEVIALVAERDQLLEQIARLAAECDRLRTEARTARAELRAAQIDSVVEVLQ